jgi:hypothetical protein
MNTSNSAPLELFDRQLGVRRNVLDNQHSQVQWHPILLESGPPALASALALSGPPWRSRSSDDAGCYLHGTGAPCPRTSRTLLARFVVRRIFDLLLGAETEIFHTSEPNDRKRDGCRGLVLAYVPEVDSEGAELPIEVGALHAHALGQLPDLAIAQKKLLLKVGALELLPGLA